MAIIHDLKVLCDRLAPHGWAALLLRHGLTITADTPAALAAELARDLPNVRRDLPGFEDYAPDGVRGIEPGSPARSLLYHALASPVVHPTDDGRPAVDPAAYPTLEELDLLENYVYALANRRLADFSGVLVTVLAYQYRTADRTPHGLYADIAYSRTGVARVGTAQPRYDPARRSFWIQPEDGGDALCVLPARYGAFLAVPRRPLPGDAILEKRPSDADREFLFAVHKLFPGRECLRGANLTLEFDEYHWNEKLRRIHTHGKIGVIQGFRVDEPPFVRDSRNSPDLVQLQRVGASVLVVPEPHERLVRTATQENSQSNREEIVRFRVPRANQNNRFWTSLQLPFNANNRRVAPEYVNIRHRVTGGPAGGQNVQDLNTLPEVEFRNLLQRGGYEAAHFIDDSCDGALSARLGGLTPGLPDQPAYSLVTAPDFFPLADQVTIAAWAQRTLGSTQEHFSQGAPDPLSGGRFPGNPDLPRPGGAAGPAFDRRDQTLTAVTGQVEFGPATPPAPGPGRATDVGVKFLPDAASNVFAPGWDVSLLGDNQGVFLAANGLGSPFPEDAKLCAALNSFWPAVAPDAARTFGGDAATGPGPTAIPILDSELGFHPDHPRVRAGEVLARSGWDGEFGPFFEERGGQQFVNYASRDRSDYTANALAGTIRLAGLESASAAELIRRMEALRACVNRVLPPATDRVSTTLLMLVTAEPVDDWAARPDRGDARLEGPGYLFVFATTQGDERQAEDLRRMRRAVTATMSCQVTVDSAAARAVCWQLNAGPFQFVPL